MKHRILLALMLPLALTGCLSFTAGTGPDQGSGVVSTQEKSAGNVIDDTSIRTKLNAIYANKDVKNLFWSIDIRVTEGRVLLTGNVNKPEDGVEAVRLAWTVPGVREVINELQVNDKSGLWDYTKDVWIEQQIRTRALLAKDIRSVNYTVQCVNGVVYLMGIAQDQGELDRMAYIARTTKGVQKVISHVWLKSDPRRFDTRAVAPQQG
jgi:osmotically-inducible protein OsmY